MTAWLTPAVIVSLMVGCSSAEPTAGVPDEATAAPSGGVALELPLPWSQVEARESRVQDDVLAQLTLRTGYSDGRTTAEIDLPFDFTRRVPPLGIGFITSSANGLAAFSLDDGERSRVQLIDIATGDVRVVWESDRPIVAGALDRTGTALYLVRANRGAAGDLEAAESEMLRLDVESAGTTSQPDAVDPEWLGDPTIRVNEFALFHFTPDGERLVVQRCADTDCTYRVVDLRTGDVNVLDPPGSGEIVGVSDTLLLAHPSDWGMTKQFVAFSIQNGVVVRRLEGQSAVLASTDGGPVVVIEEGALEDMSLVVIDPVSGERGTVTPPGIPPHGPLVPEPERQGLHLPAGWIVFGDEGRLGIDGPTDSSPVIINVESGAWVQLSNLLGD